MNLFTLLKELQTSILTRLSQTPKTYDEQPCGAGYYALRTTTSQGGRTYTKLVKADRSPAPLRKLLGLKPILGMRYPDKRKGRRKVVND